MAKSGQNAKVAKNGSNLESGPKWPKFENGPKWPNMVEFQVAQNGPNLKMAQMASHNFLEVLIKHELIFYLACILQLFSKISFSVLCK